MSIPDSQRIDHSLVLLQRLAPSSHDRADLLNHVARRPAAPAVSIDELAALVVQESIQLVCEFATHLHVPSFGGMAGAAGRLHMTLGRPGLITARTIRLTRFYS
jgi:hypothetical protein